MYYSKNCNNSVVQEFAKQGGRSVTVNDGQILLMKGQEQIFAFSIASSNFIHDLSKEDQLSAMLAAVAATWAINLPFEIIEAGIETFMPEEAIA